MADPRTIPAPPAAYQTRQAPPPPQQYLSAPDPTNQIQARFGQGVQDDPTRYAKLGAQAVASLPTQPQAKFSYMAKALGLPEDRVGIKDGRIYYVDFDGNQFFAEPGDMHPIDDPIGTLARLPDQAAGAVGPGMETAAGMGAGLATAEFGGGIPGAALGGAAGNAARQGLAYGLTDEEKPIGARLSEVGGAALQEGAGQALGLGLSKTTNAVFNRNPLRVAGYDAGGLTQKRVAEMEAAAQKARQMGIQVTPGEAGNVTSLLQRQRQLGRLPESTNQLNDFLTRRTDEQLPQAWDAVLAKISGVSAPGVGARELQTGAKETIKDAISTQQKLAGPKYKAVVNDTNLLPDDQFADLMKNDVVKVALKSVRGDKILNSELKGAKDSSLLVMNETKKRLDAMYNAAKLKLDKNRMRILDNARRDLVATADKAFPDYAAARASFEGQVPAVESLTKGLTGLSAKERASGMQAAPKTMFDITSADPMSIASARNAFEKAGRLPEWNAGLRSYLQNAFDTAAKLEQGPAPTLHKALKADTRQYANLKAAMEPNQFKAFNDFMDVLEMVKRAPKEGSPTATDIGGREAFAGSGAKTVGGIIRAFNPLNLPIAARNKIIDWSAGKNAAEMVNIITNPEAIKSLRRLKMLKPGTSKFITEMGYLTAISGFDVLKGPPEDQPAKVQP